MNRNQRIRIAEATWPSGPYSGSTQRGYNEHKRRRTDVTDYFLSYGSHATPDEGRCAMEWVAYLAGEPHSASPVCVCPTLRAFCIVFNDGLPDTKRQRLRPYLARTIGTAGDGLAEQRSWMATDWLIRVYTPTWLDLAHLEAAPARLRALPAVLDVESRSRAMVDLSQARSEADAAWGAAGDAAWGAARAAARDVAGDAARVAAWGAAWGAARAAAGAAARAAAWGAARAVAGGAARAVAGDAVRVAAWGAARAAAGGAAGGAARAAARAAARDALAPTVAELQASAFDLLDRMLPTVPLALPVVEDAEASTSISERRMGAMRCAVTDSS
jgi:hypothetical protein